MKRIFAIMLAVFMMAGMLSVFAACEPSTQITLRVLENDTAKKEGYLD